MSIFLTHEQTSFKIGDTIKVHQLVRDGEKQRTQIFEGLVIAIKGHKNEKTFTVRKIASNIGVERIFPVDTPFIKKVELVKEGRARRSKLYYLRSRTGKLALKVKSVIQSKKSENAKTKSATKSSAKSGENGGESQQAEIKE